MTLQGFKTGGTFWASTDNIGQLALAILGKVGWLVG